MKSFIERVRGAIPEKITYCMQAGLTEDEARHTVIQVVKNLPDCLLPLKDTSANEDIYSDELILTGKTIGKTLSEWPPKDVSDLD